VTHYNDIGEIAGIRTIAYSDAKAIFNHYPDSPRTTVFWNVDGSIKSIQSPDPLAYCMRWSPDLQKWILLTFKGLYAIAPKDKQISTLWYTETPLRPIWAMDNKGCIVIATGYDIGRKAYYVQAVQLRNTGTSRHYLTDCPTSVIFMDANEAMVTLASGHLVMLQLGADDNDGVTITELNKAESSGIALCTLDSAPIFLRNDSTLFYQGRDVSVNEEVVDVVAYNHELLALTKSGNILHIDSYRNIKSVYAIGPVRVIGSGSFSGGLWVATESGTVYTFGDAQKKIRVLLP
jgi:hypothetical protein